MNRLERKSFYSFLSLYIFSSLFFISLIGYWYYIAQKNALENENYYLLQHIADNKAGEIIIAQMENSPLKPTSVPKSLELALIDIHGEIKEGLLVFHTFPITSGYFKKDNYTIFISDAPHKHLDIAYVVVQSHALHDALYVLKSTVLQIMFLSFLIISLIAWLLSILFMRPIRQKVKEIERFINDVTHELNTPITALSMASNQALKDKNYTQKALKHISISTKQLYDIYHSLSYLNFNHSKEEAIKIDIAKVLEKSILYYEALCESKGMRVNVSLESYIFHISEARLTLLFANLISNAIKYSPANSSLTLRIQDGIFTIEDDGIGIEEHQYKEIFQKFKRGTDYSGGFGVGLSIVKSICDDYGIQITLNSVPTKGTKMTLNFSTILAI